MPVALPERIVLKRPSRVFEFSLGLNAVLIVMLVITLMVGARESHSLPDVNVSDYAYGLAFGAP
jgi:hypothetical protein